MNKYRALSDRIAKRIHEQKPLIQVVVGPRQIGKTTALRHALGAEGLYRTADYPTPLSFSVIESWWKEALNTTHRCLAIDEVQKINGWSEIVKQLWDAKPHALKLVLTGSSALLVEKGLKETLAGRFELIRAEHWNFGEAKAIFNQSFEDYLEFGCYPGSIGFLTDPVRWGEYIRDSIVEPALGRDLLQLHPVEQPALLRQVFGVCVSLPAQIVSLQKIQGQLQGKGTLPTLQNYLRLLADAFLVSSIEKYSNSGMRLKKSTPKLIVHDNALVRAFKRPIQQKILAAELGHYFENCIGARFIESGWDVFYWKDRDLEVDFIVLGPNGQKLAIEVKSARVDGVSLKGLKEFCRIHEGFEPCLISLEAQIVAGIRTLDVMKILSMTRENLKNI